MKHFFIISVSFSISGGSVFVADTQQQAWKILRHSAMMRLPVVASH
jgi:hypothetical protein